MAKFPVDENPAIVALFWTEVLSIFLRAVSKETCCDRMQTHNLGWQRSADGGQ
jgi:hypothetical protein